jgi:hypothetical protein
MNHSHESDNRKEYLKFAGILSFILIDSLIVMRVGNLNFLDAFMGVFFVIFAGFKLFSLKDFAHGFQSYDLIASRTIIYAYLYPFIQLFFGVMYLLGQGGFALNILVIVVSVISGAGVLNSLVKKQKVHCVCLGNVIKLPLSTISLVEDLGMGAMALTMILIR